MVAGDGIGLKVQQQLPTKTLYLPDSQVLLADHSGVLSYHFPSLALTVSLTVLAPNCPRPWGSPSSNSKANGPEVGGRPLEPPFPGRPPLHCVSIVAQFDGISTIR